MLTLCTTGFRAADWAVLAAYLALLIGTGIWLGRREQKTTGEFFLAGRRMPVWAVAVSIIATSLSAATFVGAPEQSYKGDLTYLSTNIGGLIAVIIVAWFFIPAFYKNNCTTVYELLERRFGPGSKYATSAAFMVGRLFASGARIYIAAIPLSMILFGADVASSPRYFEYMVLSIAALTIAGTLYALVGGISGVIWTDVIQTVVLVIAVAAAIVVLWNRIGLPISEVLELLRHPYERMPDAHYTSVDPFPSKLTALSSGLDFAKPHAGFDPSAQFTLLTAVLGFSLLNLAAYGTDHDMVQRMLTCKSAIQGGRSVLLSIALGIPLVLAFLVIGLLLYVFYFELLKPVLTTANDVIIPTPKPESKHVFVRFIITEMPPGLAGLMLAGLFAAGVGSLMSAINAMAATSIKDFYQRLAPNRGERHYLAASKWAVVGWGLALGGFAVLCLQWQRNSPQTTLIGLALGVMTFAYAGLLAVFCTALFTRRGSTTSVIAALITGFVVVALLQDWPWPKWFFPIPVAGPPLSAAMAKLAEIHLAFPWHMTIATTLAFGVCLLGKRPVAPVTTTDPKRCPQCGYDLTGVSSGRCPECGSSVAA